MSCPKKQDVSFLDKVTFIRRYAVDACSTPWKVYFETGANADLNLVMGIVNTSPKDFVRFLLRPKGLRTDRHAIRGLSRSKAAFEEELIPDTAKLAADTIHLVSGWHVPSWGQLGDALFEIAQPLYEIGYYLLLANVTTDFAYDWFSGILLNPQSKCDQGRWGYQMQQGMNRATPFRMVSPVFEMFPPHFAVQDGNGIQVGAGDWVVQFTLGASYSGGFGSAADIHFRMVLDPFLEKPCGDSWHLVCPANGDANAKKMVRRVKGPEWVGLQASWFDDGGVAADRRVGGQMEAFLI